MGVMEGWNEIQNRWSGRFFRKKKHNKENAQKGAGFGHVQVSVCVKIFFSMRTPCEMTLYCTLKNLA